MDSLRLDGGVSAAIGLVALVAATLIWIFGNHTPRLVAVLVLTGMAGMVGTPLGDWVRHAVEWANNTMGKLTTRWTGAAVAGLLAGAAVYVLVIRLYHRKVDRWTLGTAAVVPFAAATIPGPIGVGVYTAITAVTSAVAWAIGAAFGLG
jgi:hypothetical protein